MEYRRLGRAGIKVSAISLGAWINYGSSHTGDGDAESIIHHAVDLGINFLDVADAYEKGRAESVVGKAIKSLRRSDLVISTKAYWPMSDNVNDRGLSRKHITESVHASLKRFDTDYVDLFFCHRFDPETPIDETVRAIEDLIRAGKILYWGTSMWTAENIDDAIRAADAAGAYRPVVEQPLYNLLDRHIVEGPVGEAIERHGMGLVVWSPLAQGVLTGKYNDGIPADSRHSHVDQQWFAKQLTTPRLERARQISALAQEIGVTPAALALAWTLKNPRVSSAITGATRLSQVDDNVSALDVPLDDALYARIDSLLGNRGQQA